MGTGWSVKCVPPIDLDLETLQSGVIQRLDRVVAEMSTWLPSSSLCLYNRAPVDSWQTVPADLLTVLEVALEIARDSGGAFDPTIAPLVDLWGFGPVGPRTEVPQPDAISATRVGCSWERVVIDRDGGRILQPGGVALDFSAIAKGFAVDQVAEFLVASGVVSFLVEIGGELRGQGVKPNGDPWWVALARPASVGAAEGDSDIVALHGVAVATSGVDQKFFAANGRRYSHLLDPRTGQPSAAGLASVSVVAGSCMRADALATAIAVLGPDEGFDFARSRGIAALLLSREGDRLVEAMTPALGAMLE